MGLLSSRSAQAASCGGSSCWKAWALEHGLSSCGSQALLALQHMGSSRTRDQTRVPCICRRILKPWSTSEVHPCHFWILFSVSHSYREGWLDLQYTLKKRQFLISSATFPQRKTLQLFLLALLCLLLCLWVLCVYCYFSVFVTLKNFTSHYEGWISVLSSYPPSGILTLSTSTKASPVCVLIGTLLAFCCHCACRSQLIVYIWWTVMTLPPPSPPPPRGFPGFVWLSPV